MQSNKIDSLQVVRALAFLLIFLSHVEIISTGPIGVSIFIVLSGFCMTYSYLDRPEKIKDPSVTNNFHFSIGKIKKLYPLHVVTLTAVAVVVFSELFRQKASVSNICLETVLFFFNALLLQSWLPFRDGYYSFNAVSWYFSTSLFFYFAFPIVFRIIQSKNKQRISILLVSTFVLMILGSLCLDLGNHYLGWTRAFSKWFTYIFPIYRLGDFIFGLISGYIFTSIKHKYNRGLISVLEILVIGLMIIQVILYNSKVIEATSWMLSLFWLPTSILFVSLFALNLGITSRVLTKSRLLVWIGDISGEAFLLHQICIKAVQHFFSDKVIVASISLVITIISSIAWRFLYTKFKRHFEKA